MAEIFSFILAALEIQNLKLSELIFGASRHVVRYWASAGGLPHNSNAETTKLQKIEFSENIR